jgi:hypothetical protein
MLYTEDENVTCYRCDQEEYNKIETKSSKFIEYMKIHLISLEQDVESIEGTLTEDDNYIWGQIVATKHLLSVATDIMNSTNERV